MSKNIKRIWILNHHANGNGDRHDSLATQLTKLGVEVYVIASSYNHFEQRYIYKDKVCIQDKKENLKYIWLKTTPAYVGNGLKRIQNMLSYLRMVKQFSLDWCNKFGVPDIIIGSSVHPFAWEAAYWISKKVGADFYAEVRDLWPLSLIEVQGVNRKHPFVTFLGILERRAYRRAKKIITTMPYGDKYISDKLGIPKEKIEWIPNGIDTGKVDVVIDKNIINLPNELDRYLEENWCAVYTGSLVESECVDFILEAAEVLQSKGNNLIKFAIVGGGHMKNQLIEEVKRRKLNNVRFFDRISKEQVSLTVAKSKVCLAAVRNLSIYKYGLSMNKLNDYLYSGNPTVFVCDVDNVVKTSSGGITVPFGDSEVFADAIEKIFNMSDLERKIMTDRGRQIIKDQYDTGRLAEQLLKIFQFN